MFYTLIIRTFSKNQRGQTALMRHYQSLVPAMQVVEEWTDKILKASRKNRVFKEMREPFTILFAGNMAEAVYQKIIADKNSVGFKMTIIKSCFSDTRDIHENTFKTCVVFGENAARAFADKEYVDDEIVAEDDLPMSLDKAEVYASEKEGEIIIRAFATENERQAYYLGLSDNDGWGDCYSAGPNEIAVPDNHDTTTEEADETEETDNWPPEKMYKAYPTKTNPKADPEMFEPSYCATREEAEDVATRMQAWTGVRWKIEEMDYDENRITY